MSGCFADTFYFLAMVNPHDAAHQRVTQLNASLRRPIVTTAWVLTEVADALAHTSSRSLFRILSEQLEISPRATVILPSAQLFSLRKDLYNGRPDKQWSLTDCISFVVMQQHGLADALTGDHHFEQAGFKALLR